MAKHMKNKPKAKPKKKKGVKGSDLLGSGIAKTGANTIRSAIARRKAILDNL